MAGVYAVMDETTQRVYKIRGRSTGGESIAIYVPDDVNGGFKMGMIHQPLPDNSFVSAWLEKDITSLGHTFTIGEVLNPNFQDGTVLPAGITFIPLGGAFQNMTARQKGVRDSFGNEVLDPVATGNTFFTP